MTLDNRIKQSFILDRLFFEARAGALKAGVSNTKICSDVYFDKRLEIMGNNKTSVSKISDVTPITCDKIDELVREGKYDIEWEITIGMFFEGDDGLKLLSDTIKEQTGYRDWKQWYTQMKTDENIYWEKGMKR